MNAETLTRLETCLQSVERQNRILVAMLAVAAGLALLGAAKGPGGNILTVDELRAHRLALIGDDGGVVHSWTVHGAWVVEK